MVYVFHEFFLMGGFGMAVLWSLWMEGSGMPLITSIVMVMRALALGPLHLKVLISGPNLVGLYSMACFGYLS